MTGASMGSVPSLYNEGLLQLSWISSTVTLRVAGGDENGSLKSETVKYGREYQGTRTRKRLCWQGPAAYTKDSPVLSSEKAPHKNKTATVKQ
jgi:hypothetical protein